MSNEKYFQDIKVDLKEKSETNVVLTAEPFEKGYGVTVGNGLRRTLLTALPGAAITSLKIDDVTHEFTSIPGILEDVSEIILNLKAIRFFLKDPEAASEIIELKLSNKTNFTAKNINDKLTNFEVINLDQHIATINSKKELVIEIRVSRGKGYSTADDNKRSDDALNTIPIDSIFNPILNVAWDVTPIASSIDGQERLILDVTSDGSTSPKDAINHASKIMQEHLNFLRFDDASVIKAINDEQLNETLEIKAILMKSIDEMELSVRSHNCLQAAGIETIGELVEKEESEMLKFKNFGRKSLTELTEKLNDLELKFGMDVSSYLDE